MHVSWMWLVQWSSSQWRRSCQTCLVDFQLNSNNMKYIMACIKWFKTASLDLWSIGVLLPSDYPTCVTWMNWLICLSSQYRVTCCVATRHHWIWWDVGVDRSIACVTSVWFWQQTQDTPISWTASRLAISDCKHLQYCISYFRSINLCQCSYPLLRRLICVSCPRDL